MARDAEGITQNTGTIDLLERCLQAGQADLDLTKKLRDGGKLLDIQILDHIIITGEAYFSFADEGLL